MNQIIAQSGLHSLMKSSGLEFFNTSIGLLVIYNKRVVRFNKLPPNVLKSIEFDLRQNPWANRSLLEWKVTDRLERLELYAACRFGVLDFFSPAKQKDWW